jgi:transcriptional regulator GlxA family with amidase domain
MPIRTIAIAIPDCVQALDVAGPADVFAEANTLIGAEDQYCVVLTTALCGSVRTSNGTRIVTDRSLADAREPYAVVLVAGSPTLPDAEPDPRLCAWLLDVVPHAGLYGSVCTGAFALGHAGLLDGHAVTTHWQNAARLAAMFPKARVEADRIHMRDGRLITSAGVTAGIDLALALVAEHHSAGVALAVAKRLVVVTHRQGGQSQFSPLLVAAFNVESPLAKVQTHVLDHIGDAHTVDALARVAGMSTRSLARLFLEELGVTPRTFVEGIRVDAARNLLEGGDLPLKVVAFKSGFGSADRMRMVFARRLGVSPAQYREQFGST